MEHMKRENIGWIDLLRVIACFLVLVSHSCDPFVGQLDADPNAFLTGAFIGSAVRACVPLFVMMTAVLLLPVKIETGSFYRKRIGRILTPLVFWSIALPLLYFAYLHHTATDSPNIAMDDFTWNATWHKLYTFIFNFNYDTTPLWYLYMLIGLYLVMPILSAWLRQSTKREIETVLGIWVFTLFIPYIKILAPVLGYPGNYGNMGLWGICDWNEFGAFYYMSGFIGYLVLAYYLTNYPLTWSLRRTLWTCIPLFFIGYLITSVGFVLTHKYFPENFANLEIIWSFCGINVGMMTVAIFLIVQKLEIKSSPQLSEQASLTFGVYLCHFVFVQFAYDLTDSIQTHFIRVFAIAVQAFAMSFAVVWLMAKSKLLRRFIA